MSVTIDQITHWTRPYRSVGCIVVEAPTWGWVFTGCGSFQTGDAVTDRPPKVCRKCQAKLKDLSLKPTAEASRAR